MSKKVVILASLFLLAGFVAFAASTDTTTVNVTINPVAQIACYPAGAIALATPDTAVPGLNPADAIDVTKYLNYTVINHGTAGKITVVSSAAVPAGLSLGVAATTAAGAGTGSTIASIPIGTAADFVTAISSVATGQGAVGAHLTYTLHITDITQLDTSATSNPVVTYTVSAN
jgi:hypothetical protein